MEQSEIDKEISIRQKEKANLLKQKSKNGDDRSELSRQIEVTDGEVTAARRRMEGLQDQIKGLERSRDTLDRDASSIDDRIKKIDDEIDGLRGEPVYS